MTGVIGAAGGFGGFLLPSALGAIKDRAGTFGLGFALFSLVALVGASASGIGTRVADIVEPGMRTARGCFRRSWKTTPPRNRGCGGAAASRHPTAGPRADRQARWGGAAGR